MTKKEYENFLLAHEAFVALSKEVKVEFISYDNRVLKVLNLTTNRVQTFELVNGAYYLANKTNPAIALAFNVDGVNWALVLQKIKYKEQEIKENGKN